MKNLNFLTPLAIIVFAVLLGFFMNYKNGLDWTASVADMTKSNKILTYGGLFVVIFVWKNWTNLKKG